MSINEDRSDDHDIAHQMVRGAVWMIAMRGVMKVMGFVNIMILVRLLTPDDFGIVAMATIFIGLITTLTDGSFDQAILRQKNAPEQTWHAAWTLQVIAGLVATIGIFAIIPLATAFFDDARLAPLLLLAGLKPAIHGFENIGQLEFRKQFQFKKEFKYWILRQITSIVIVISLALWFRNFWALALAMPLSSVAVVVLSYIMAPFRPHFTRHGLRGVFAFSRWLILLDSSTYAGGRFDELVVGRIADAETLGFYYVASDIATMPTRELVMPLDRAFVPTMAHITHDDGELTGALKNTIGAVATICIPTGLGLYAIAENFIVVVLGEVWRPAIPYFEWLAIYGIFSAMVLSLRSYFMVTNKIRVYSLFYLAYVAGLAMTLTTLSITSGVEAIAPARTLCCLGLMVLIYGYLAVTAKIKMKDFGRQLIRPAIAGTAMVATLDMLDRTLTMLTPLTLAIKISVGILTFLLILTAFWLVSGRPPGIEKWLFGKISTKE